MASSEQFPIDLKTPLYPNTGDPTIDFQLGILYKGIRNLAGDYYDNTIPAIPFQAAGAGAVGNGALTYLWRVRGGMCRLDFQIAIGATTFLGGGAVPILFTPPTAFPPLGTKASSGTAVIFCAAAGLVAIPGVVFCLPPGPNLAIITAGGALTPVFPGAFAAGDSISFSIDYPYVQ